MIHNTRQDNTSRLKPRAFLYRLFSAFIAFTFACNLIIPPNLSFAQTILNLPTPGEMIMPGLAFTPPLIRGIIVHPENPLKFDFIIDSGDKKFDDVALRQEAMKLIKYFMASVTLPEEDVWVNLSPYEKDRIVPQEFGITEMGKDLLSQDYILKQLTASLMYPESELGQKFWQKIYAKAQSLYGTTNIPINTFNKVWIVPDKAVVHERTNSAFVVESHLSVMLEGDYLALQENLNNKKLGTDHLQSEEVKKLHAVSSDIVKEIILPEIEKEVNEGKAFANLRQIYNAEILAYWYKTALKESLLGQVYANKKKVKGVDVKDKEIKQKIYEQYLAAFKIGVYNYIKEDIDPVTQKTIPRKYFSGGYDGKVLKGVYDNHLTREQRLAEGKHEAEDEFTDFTIQVAGVRPGAKEDDVRQIVDKSFTSKEQTPQVKIEVVIPKQARRVQELLSGKHNPDQKGDVRFTITFSTIDEISNVQGALIEKLVEQAPSENQKELRELLQNGRKKEKEFFKMFLNDEDLLFVHQPRAILFSKKEGEKEFFNGQLIIHPEHAGAAGERGDSGARTATVIDHGLFKGLPEAFKALNDRDLTGVRVLVRAVQNVEIDEQGNINDKTRLNETLPVLKFLLDRGADVIVIGHNGRLEGRDSRKSLRATTKFFQEQFPDTSVEFYPNSIPISNEGLKITSGDLKRYQAKKAKGSLHLLENLRFAPDYEQGEKNSPQRKEFGRKLTGLAEIYIVDAYADLDSKGTSIEDLPIEFIQQGKEVFVGPSMIEVADKLSPVVDSGVNAIIAAGEKEDKIGPVKDIVEGNLAQGGFVLLGSLPSSRLNDNPVIKGLVDNHREQVIAAVDYNAPQETFDIGLETIKLFKQKLNTLSLGQNVVVNGVLGYIEGGYTQGTREIADTLKELAQRGVNIIFVGGSGVSMAKEYGLDQLEHVILISGGGVPLKILAGNELAGVKALREAAANRPGIDNASLTSLVDAPVLHEDIEKTADLLGVQKESVEFALTHLADKKKILVYLTESVAISQQKTLDNMIEAGMARRLSEKPESLDYELLGNAFNPEVLWKFIRLQTASSSNSELIDLTEMPVRLERILLSAINLDDFVGILTPQGDVETTVHLLRQHGLFPTLTQPWQRQETLALADPNQVPLRVEDSVSLGATDFYRQHGIDVQFNLPEGTMVGQSHLQVVQEEEDAFQQDMSRGGYPYRGAGTHQTVAEFFRNYFQPRWYERIRNYAREQFDGGTKLRYIVTDGIGANAQFMWSEVEMYNRNKPEGAPTWYHVVTARDLENLPSLGDMTPENTLLVHLSRSGSTLEGVDVANRLLQEGFNKMIVLANGGALGSIVKQVPNTSMQIGMQVHIGGRNMHRKTPLYEAVQTIAGMFYPAMDSPNFARYHDEFDHANDLGSENSLPVNAARFLYTLMKTQRVEHIATMTNTKQLALIASEGNQFFMEGANGEHRISWGDHDLTNEPDFVLENLASGPAGKITMGIALLDKASPTYEAEARRVDEVAKRMPLMRFTIDSRNSGMDGINLQHQAGFDMFWTDFVSALTTFLRVDNNANPNVADVRQRTALYASRWRERAERYDDDAVGTGKATMLVSYGHPGTSTTTALGNVEKQKPAKTTDDMKELAKTMVDDLAQKGMFKGRNRLNIFAGTNKLLALMQRLRNNTYRTPLSTREGWIIETGIYPNRAHTGHEATLAHSDDPAHPLLADRTVNIFFNTRKLGEGSWFNHIFQNVTGDDRFDSLNGANIDQLTDAMTFPNAEAAARFSPTVMLEFDHQTPETDELLEAFYTAFVEELDRVLAEQGNQDNAYLTNEGGPTALAPDLQEKVQATNVATANFDPTQVGGINLRLNPAILDFQIKRDGNGIPLPINQQPIGDMKIEGFIPIFLYQKPVSLPLLLSSLEGQPANPSSPARQSRIPKTNDPMDLSYSSPRPWPLDPKRRKN